MAKYSEPFNVLPRSNSNTYHLTLNYPACELPESVCKEWYRRSFQHLPIELSAYRNPKSKGTAKVAARALIKYLDEKEKEKSTRGTLLSCLSCLLQAKKDTEAKTTTSISITPIFFTIKTLHNSYYSAMIHGLRRLISCCGCGYSQLTRPRLAEVPVKQFARTMVYSTS